MIAIGIDVGGTSIKGATIKEGGKILDRFSMPTDKNLPPEEIFSPLCDTIITLLKEKQYSEPIAGIGVAIPGTFNNKTGEVVNCPNLPTWAGFPVKKYIEDKCHLFVKVVNDADAAALGEAKFGSGKDVNYMLMLTLGTGVGGGIVINKQIYNGNLGMGAELGHMVIEVNGRPCGCGRKGCFEAYGSATALIKETKRMMEEHPESLLNKYAEELGVVDARVAFLAEKAGDKYAKEIVDDYVMYLSEGILNYCNIFRPNAVVLSGGVANEGDNLLDRVRAYLKLHNYGMKNSPQVQIRQAELGYDSGKIGAAALFI